MWDRERKEREGSVISVAESMSRKRRRNSIRSHSLQTHRKFFLLNEISEKTWNEELFLVKIQLRENWILTVYDVKLQSLERRNSEYALIESRRELESQRRQLLESNQWADQLSVREYTCVLEMKNGRHQECYARGCQEIDEVKRRCFQLEKWSISTKVS